MHSLIEEFLFTISFGIVLYFMHRSQGAQHAVTEGNRTLLRLPKIHYFMGILGVVMGYALVVAWLYETDKDYSSTLTFLLIFIFFEGVGYLFILRYRNYRVEFDDQVIQVTTWRKRSHQMRWSDIEKVRFKAFNQEYELRNATGKMRISEHLAGIAAFRKTLHSKTGYKHPTWSNK